MPFETFFTPLICYFVNCDPVVSSLPSFNEIVPAEVQPFVERLGRDAATNVFPLAGAVLGVATKGGDAVEVLKEANGDVVTVITENDVVATVKKAANDAAATYVKGWRDVAEQSKRSFKDSVEAGEAIGRYGDRQFRDLLQTIPAATRRLQEGKVVDAVWGLTTEPLQAAERNFAKATQESEIIASAAQSAAATYGGPGGAAAYAAWATYRATGDANLALRAGIVAAVTSQTGSGNGLASGKAVNKTTEAVLKKAALAGATGGIAVAAAGGDEAAITQAFLRTGSAVLIQAGTDRVKGYSPKAKQAVEAVQCISARDMDCLTRTPYAQKQGKILLDKYGNPELAKKVEDLREYAGKWSKDTTPLAKKYELLSKLSKLKGEETIPLLNNEWVLTYNFGKTAKLEPNTPAVVLTYVGTNRPFVSLNTYGSAQNVAHGTVPSSEMTAAVLAKAVRIQSGDVVRTQEYALGELRDTYDYRAWLELEPKQADMIRSVEYFFDAPTFKNPKAGQTNGIKFEARWIGWGCAEKARAVATLIDGRNITGHFNMCSAKPG